MVVNAQPRGISVVIDPKWRYSLRADIVPRRRLRRPGAGTGSRPTRPGTTDTIANGPSRLLAPARSPFERKGERMGFETTIRCDWCLKEMDTNDVGTFVEAIVGDEDEKQFLYHPACWDELTELLEFSRRAQAELNLLPTCEEPPDPLAAALSVCELPIHRTGIDALQAAGIFTFGQLAERSAEELLGIRGIGWGRLEAIEEALASHGLGFAGEVSVSRYKVYR